MLNSIIIEDEPIAVSILESYIVESGCIINKANFINTEDALHFLQSHQIDVIFIDIHLPGQKGNEFAKKIGLSKQIIFTTAYAEFAVEAFNIQAVDYLMKPFSYDRFLQSISKLKKKDDFNKNYIEINENKRKYRIKYSEIIYIESYRDYCHLHLSSGDKIQTKITISALAEKLTAHNFIRIHKSYIVNKSLITIITQNEVTVANFTLPLGRNYKRVLDFD